MTLAKVTDISTATHQNFVEHNKDVGESQLFSDDEDVPR
jgi:hypothetical protein